MKTNFGSANHTTYVVFRVSTASDTPEFKTFKGAEKYPLWGHLDTKYGHFSHLKDLEVKKVGIAYVDLVHSCAIAFEYNITYPKIKVYTRLPNKCVIPEFFLEGHFKISEIQIHSEKRSVVGKTVDDLLAQGKTVNLWNKLFFIKTGEPQAEVTEVETPLGVIRSIKKKVQDLEI